MAEHKPKHMLKVRLTAEQHWKLNVLSERTLFPVRHLIKEALEQYLAQHDWEEVAKRPLPRPNERQRLLADDSLYQVDSPDGKK